MKDMLFDLLHLSTTWVGVLIVIAMARNVHSFTSNTVITSHHDWSGLSPMGISKSSSTTTFYSHQSRSQIPHRYLTSGNRIPSQLSASKTSDQNSKYTTNNDKVNQKKLSRPERKALEREKKTKINSGDGQRKFNLHSTKVSVLCKSTSTADDVVTAIKRAQNKHDVHDIRNIANFLLNEVDSSFGYGFRGSLLARLAVAALHMSEQESARRAIEVRKAEHSASMLPLESAAIIRGFLRVHNVTDAIDMLENELPLPIEVRRTFVFCIFIPTE